MRLQWTWGRYRQSKNSAGRVIAELSERGYWGAPENHQPEYLTRHLVKTLPLARQTCRAALEAAWMTQGSYLTRAKFKTMRELWRDMYSNLRRYCREAEQK